MKYISSQNPAIKTNTKRKVGYEDNEKDREVVLGMHQITNMARIGGD
jgi:hypothetical protein